MHGFGLQGLEAYLAGDSQEYLTVPPLRLPSPARVFTPRAAVCLLSTLQNHTVRLQKLLKHR